MGGPTNIHHASQILLRAGREMTDQAYIMPFNKAVLVVGREFKQEEINVFTYVLRSAQRDVWTQYNNIYDAKPTTSDKGVPIPAIYTSPGLADNHDYGLNLPSNHAGEPVDLAFVIIVRGASAALFSKVRVFYSYFAVAAGIMEDALQGWSVVFSAAMLKRDVHKLGQISSTFEKVGKLSELTQSVDEERASKSVLLYC